MTSELIPKLTDFGFTQYESKTYLALLNETTCSARDLSNMCGMPYGKTYEIIKGLAKKGCIEIHPTKPLRCSAVAPEHVFKSIKENLLSKVKHVEDQLKKKRTKKRIDSKELKFLIVKGRSLINRHMESLFRDAKEHIFICATENVISRLNYFDDTLKPKQKEGIEIKIFHNGKGINKKTFSFVLYENDSKMCFISVDGKRSLFFVPSPDSVDFVKGGDSGMLVLDKSMTQFMDILFSNCVKLNKLQNGLS